MSLICADENRIKHVDLRIFATSAGPNIYKSSYANSDLNCWGCSQRLF